MRMMEKKEKESQDTIGQMLIFLNWDKEKGGFFISEIMYMPDYVENTF